jgi:hypothetical protein
MAELREGNREWPEEWREYAPGGRFACRADFHSQRASVARQYGFSPLDDIRALTLSESAHLYEGGPPCPPEGCTLCVRPWMEGHGK